MLPSADRPRSCRIGGGAAGIPAGADEEKANSGSRNGIRVPGAPADFPEEGIPLGGAGVFGISFSR
ncbi:hypothetical protein GCM10010298_27840 [Streptomyces microflavus]|uniref:Uncharacterized protein n=1 Tax=Streptomyces microflavus TaxID=1919 RepID=A0A7J0CY42_STRMI|nr:hypothetical protein Smic_58640 [Streptomyces microflavus]GGX61649.1 hypothetical protein GCM10010298_27840 [Streptomyces microflavus]